jgi:hypothetical protein
MEHKLSGHAAQAKAEVAAHLPNSGQIGLKHGLIKYLDFEAKCRHLKKLTMKRDFAAGVYLSEAPSPPRFLFGVV